MGRGLRMGNGESLNPMTKQDRNTAILDALDLLGNAIEHRDPWEVLDRRWQQVNVLVSHKVMADGQT